MTTRKTPFYDVGIAAGADMRELFGYWLPWEYAPGHREEHLATRNAATVCDLDYMAVFDITGQGRLAFLQHVCTNDFSDLPAGGVRYTTMCGDDGKMIDDGTVWNFGDRFVFITGDEGDYEWLSQEASAFDVVVSDKTLEWTTLAVQGPASREIIQSLTEADLSTINYYRFTAGSIAGVACTIARLGYTGEYGFELHFHPRDAEAVWNAVLTAGESHGLAPCGQAALESLRQEAGYLLVGNDHDKETNPIEAGLGWTVKFDKSNFKGKDALAKLMEKGVGRQLVWLDLADKTELSAGARVETLHGQPIGKVTSSSFSPTRERAVAMAYVTSEWAVKGMRVQIQDELAIRSASVSVMPLYDPGDTRTRPSTAPASASRS